MKRTFLLLTLAVVCSLHLSAQGAQINWKKAPKDQHTQLSVPDSALLKNAFHLSLGIFAQNLYYEHRIGTSRNATWHMKLGYGINQGIFSGRSQQAIASIAWIGSKQKNSHLEFNAGGLVRYHYESYQNNRAYQAPNTNMAEFIDLSPVVYVGYRYQKPGKPFVFRLGIGAPEFLAFSFGLAF